MTSKTALLIIDVQTSMFDPEQPPHAAEQVLANVGGLLERARASGTDVIYVRHNHARYEPMMPGHPGFEIHTSISPEAASLQIASVAAARGFTAAQTQQLRELVDSVIDRPQFGFLGDPCVNILRLNIALDAMK